MTHSAWMVFTPAKVPLEATNANLKTKSQNLACQPEARPGETMREVWKRLNRDGYTVELVSIVQSVSITIRETGE